MSHHHVRTHHQSQSELPRGAERVNQVSRENKSVILHADAGGDKTMHNAALKSLYHMLQSCRQDSARHQIEWRRQLLVVDVTRALASQSSLNACDKATDSGRAERKSMSTHKVGKHKNKAKKLKESRRRGRARLVVSRVVVIACFSASEQDSPVGS